mgnify:CR=1 FL=1
MQAGWRRGRDRAAQGIKVLSDAFVQVQPGAPLETKQLRPAVHLFLQLLGQLTTRVALTGQSKHDQGDLGDKVFRGGGGKASCTCTRMAAVGAPPIRAPPGDQNPLYPTWDWTQYA